MATSSSTATSPGSIQLQNSSFCQEDLADVKDLKKRKRLMSNRESARRSRLKRKNLLNDLLAHVKKLQEDNIQMMQTMSLSNQLYLHMEAENLVLRAQMAELHFKLQSLKDVIDVIMISSSCYTACETNPLDHDNVNVINNGDYLSLSIPFCPFYMNQPTIAAPAGIFM